MKVFVWAEETFSIQSSFQINIQEPLQENCLLPLPDSAIQRSVVHDNHLVMLNLFKQTHENPHNLGKCIKFDTDSQALASKRFEHPYCASYSPHLTLTSPRTNLYRNKQVFIK